MDNLGVVLQGYQRQYPAGMKVHSLGHIVKKTAVITHSFSSFNFSLILEGEGFYGHEGQTPVPVKAPCVLTQWPGAPMNYGAPEGGWWRELYLIYMPEEIPAIARLGFLNPAKRWWPVENPGRFFSAAEDLLKLAGRIREPGMPDRIDRAAETVVLESLLPGPFLLNKSDQAVLRIKAVMERDCRQEQDLDRLAAEEGLSSSVFRRLWKKHVGMSPHRYLIELRMTQARRLLTETGMNISEIAYRTGYGDPLYFSRLFHKTTGFSASDYRRAYCPERH